MSRRTVLLAALLTTLAALLPATAASAAGHRDRVRLAWQLTPTGSTASFRGLSAVSRDVAWVGGDDGSVLRTVDGGRHWQNVSPPDSTGLLFRDVEAFGRDTANVLAIGPGDASRIYRTTDGGAHWTRTFTNADPDAFYDCMAFFADRRHGLAVSDPAHGAWQLAATNDGGRSWQPLTPVRMPAALDGEFGFAASGTCLTTSGDKDAWFGGGGTAARVFRTTDRGRTWSVAATPIHVGDAAGISSLAFRDRRHGLAVGSDFGPPPTSASNTLARSRDGGRSWRDVPAAPSGLREGAAWLRHDGDAIALLVGPGGSSFSTDDGRTWTAFDAGAFHTVSCTRGGSCWAAGTAGRAARLLLRD
jgi:photosystem II stability/assembly factor-like uncharacterized protein